MNNKGRFKKGERRSPATEFKKGEHWRPKKPYWNRDWLNAEYTDKNRSASDIANEFGITEAAILFWLRKHGIPRRDMVEIRSKKHWGLTGEKNGMYGKTGKDNPNWLGGITPERQELYANKKWKKACSIVYRRDGGRCARCLSAEDLHVHHIVSFGNVSLRTEPSNLILLCKKCHTWVHSKRNVNKEFIKEEVRE